MSSTYSPITILEPTTHTYHMEHTTLTTTLSSTYSPITILDPITHIWNKQHWPHVQYVQSYHYIRLDHTHTEQTTLITCPVCTVQSLYYIPPHTYGTHNTDHMSSMYSPITILEHTTLIHNKQHWPHVQYVQSYHYIIFHHAHTEHTTLTTCPVCTVQSLY